MYVVDMYRGVVQAGGIWSEYLTDYIKKNEMVLPVGTGGSGASSTASATARAARSRALSKATPQELVATLSHPNGWWRDTAQQLLVERGDTVGRAGARRRSPPRRRTGARGCTRCGRSTGSTRSTPRSRPEGAWRRQSADVRAAAVRLSERWLDERSGAQRPP